MKVQMTLRGCAGSLWVLLFVTTFPRADAGRLGGDKLIEELESSEESEVLFNKVKTRYGFTLDTTVVTDRKNNRKLIVNTKGDKEDEVLYEDCQEKVEYILSAKDPNTCYVHDMTEEEVLRLCMERDQKALKAGKGTRKPQKLLDSYEIGEEILSPLKSPPLCASRKHVRLIPQILGSIVEPAMSDLDTESKRQGTTVYCCCSTYREEVYCCETCKTGGKWWRRTRYYCCKNCTRRVVTGRACETATFCQCE